MDDLSRGERERMFSWATANATEELWEEMFSFRGDADSYYHSYDNDDNIREFGFDTVPEFRKELERIWDADGVMGDMITICAVAAFKNRPQVAMKDENVRGLRADEGGIDIPEYVYAM